MTTATPTPCATPYGPGHDDVEVRPVRAVADRKARSWDLCRGCRRHQSNSAFGVEFVERRVADVAVPVDRRRFVPLWLRRGRLERDLTGASR